jgi:predicted ester cyclase
MAAVAAAFPDRRYTTDLLIASGDKVAIVWSGTATHQGETFGVPPTGKAVTLNGIDILRIADGQVVEAWSTSDNLGTLIQLGAFPPPGTPTT